MDASAMLDLAIPFIIAIFATVWTFWGLEWWLKRGEDRNPPADKHTKAAS